MPNPWDRQRDEDGELEPGRWYHRFTMFRALGHDRSLLRVCNQWRQDKDRKVSTSTPLSWTRASRQWRWLERAESWDEHRRQLDYIAEQAEHDEMRKRHADIGKALQGVGAKALSRFQNAGAGQLEPSDARLYLKDGIGIERTARGLPVELLALYNMSDEEIQKEYESSNAALRGPDPSPQSDRDGDAGQGPDADAAD